MKNKALHLKSKAWKWIFVEYTAFLTGFVFSYFFGGESVKHSVINTLGAMVAMSICFYLLHRKGKLFVQNDNEVKVQK